MHKVLFSFVAILAFHFWLTAVQAGEAPPPPEAKPSAPKPKPGAAKVPVANNSACFVCHVNFQEEELAVTHAKAGVGCVKCHGKSRAHTDDEANLIPPEIMYAKAKINASCLKCHPAAKLSESHKPVLAGTETKHPYCIDCHGEHRVPHRTRHWNKDTGKLLPD